MLFRFGKSLETAGVGIKQQYAVLDKAQYIIILCQFDAADAVAGKRQTIIVLHLEGNEAVTIKAVKTVIGGYPHHSRTILHSACGPPMAHTITIVIES